MPLTSPHNAIYPKKHFQAVEVLHDGTVDGSEFSIAKIELKDGRTVFGIRHDRNIWNEHNEENGYPVVRGGLPSWFILPDIGDLLIVLERMKDNT